MYTKEPVKPWKLDEPSRIEIEITREDIFPESLTTAGNFQDLKRRLVARLEKLEAEGFTRYVDRKSYDGRMVWVEKDTPREKDPAQYRMEMVTYEKDLKRYEQALQVYIKEKVQWDRTQKGSKKQEIAQLESRLAQLRKNP